MSKTKSKDTRQDCVFRFTDSNGQLICNNAGYEHSKECISIYGLNPYAKMAKPNDSTRGGFVIHNPVTVCRGCKYYLNDYSVYVKHCKEIGLN